LPNVIEWVSTVLTEIRCPYIVDVEYKFLCEKLTVCGRFDQ